MKGLIEQDALRHELRMALIWSFARAGYSNEESSKLADIAIGPVDQALKCAKAIYNLKVESVERWYWPQQADGRYLQLNADGSLSERNTYICGPCEEARHDNCTISNCFCDCHPQASQEEQK